MDLSPMISNYSKCINVVHFLFVTLHNSKIYRNIFVNWVIYNLHCSVHSKNKCLLINATSPFKTLTTKANYQYVFYILSYIQYISSNELLITLLYYLLL